MRFGLLVMIGLLAGCASEGAIPGPPDGPSPPIPDILARSSPAEWRRVDPENTLYMDLPGGRVIIEMAPRFAPEHAENVRTLTREDYFEGGAVTRVQDNYVAQWAQAREPARPPVRGRQALKGEFVQPRSPAIPFDSLPDPDTYAPEVGFSEGFPAGRNAKEIWLAHCYGTVGVGRDNDPDTGSGVELYAVIGHSPRGLDRNITVLGRVIQGVEHLSSLPRGSGPLGFYERPEQYVRFGNLRLAADVPPAERTELEILRTDSRTFAELVNSRRWRKDDFYHTPIGRIGLCNISVPVRPLRTGPKGDPS